VSAVIRLEGNDHGVILPYEFGELVEVDGRKGLVGKVVGFCIYKGYAEVEVAWFSNGDAKSAWFHEWRVQRHG
jgi:hypothetical protein